MIKMIKNNVKGFALIGRDNEIEIYKGEYEENEIFVDAIDEDLRVVQVTDDIYMFDMLDHYIAIQILDN